MPATLPVDWSEVRRASELGVSDIEIMAKFGIPDGTAIRQRRWREKWVTPAKIQEQKEIAEATRRIKAQAGTRRIENQGAVTTVTLPLVTQEAEPKTPVTALSVTAETLTERAQAYSLTVFDAASKAVQTALPKLPTPDSWKTAAIADAMARRAAGLDRVENTSVTLVQLGGWQASLQDVAGESGRIIDQEPDGHSCDSEGPTGDCTSDPPQDAGEDAGRF